MAPTKTGRRKSPAADLKAAKRSINAGIREEIERLQKGSSGFVYVVSNRPDLRKIGMTTRDPWVRLASLNNTSVADDYRLLAAWEHPEPLWLEGEVHKALAADRYRSDREFFRSPLRKIKATVNRLTKQAKPFPLPKS